MLFRSFFINSTREEILKEIDLIEVSGVQSISYTVEAWCKWSVVSSLIDNADHKDVLKRRIDNTEYTQNCISIMTLCKKLNISFECYSEELGMEFQEHIIVNSDGDIIKNDVVDYEEIYNENDEIVGTKGGFGDWNFEILNDKKLVDLEIEKG